MTDGKCRVSPNKASKKKYIVYDKGIRHNIEIKPNGNKVNTKHITGLNWPPSKQPVWNL